ncbi:hypothetical protein TNCV_850661 [Trichonephila clavipes]|nr:hypothetical protein TNCV_850661 [Trichonephila clavipes]
MQPLGVGGVDVRDFEVKNCYESSGRDWSARSAPIGGEGVCLKWVIERFEKIVVKVDSSLGVHKNMPKEQRMVSQPCKQKSPYWAHQQQNLIIFKKADIQSVRRAYRGRLERFMEWRRDAVSTE